jgi:hypothetical protein
MKDMAKNQDDIDYNIATVLIDGLNNDIITNGYGIHSKRIY